MSDSWDELLNEAREALQEQQDENPNADAGDDMTPPEEGHFMGRWRGAGKLQTKERGLVDVFLVWDRDDNRGFLWASTRLVQEVKAEQPQVGDRVLVLRGPTETFEKDGEARKVFPFVLRRQACADPLPEQPAAPQVAAGEEPASDEDIPFLCLARSVTRSVRAAAAATVSA
jgi:hypothetical protein